MVEKITNSDSNFADELSELELEFDLEPDLDNSDSAFEASEFEFSDTHGALAHKHTCADVIVRSRDSLFTGVERKNGKEVSSQRGSDTHRKQSDGRTQRVRRGRARNYGKGDSRFIVCKAAERLLFLLARKIHYRAERTAKRLIDEQLTIEAQSKNGSIPLQINQYRPSELSKLKVDKNDPDFRRFKNTDHASPLSDEALIAILAPIEFQELGKIHSDLASVISNFGESITLDLREAFDVWVEMFEILNRCQSLYNEQSESFDIETSQESRLVSSDVFMELASAACKSVNQFSKRK